MNQHHARLLAALTLSLTLAPRAALAQGQKQGEAQDPQAQQDKQRAREQFALGVGLFDAGDFAGAAAAFERAHAAWKSSLILYNLALALERTERKVATLDAFERVVASPGALPADKLARAKQGLEAAKKKVGQLEIVANLAGASVTGPEGLLGATPLASAVRVPVGPVTLVASAPGHVPAFVTARVDPEARSVVTIELAPIQKKLGALRVRTPVPASTLFVDGKEIAPLPLKVTVPLEAGAPHRVEVRRPGYRAAVEEVTVAEGGVAELDLTPRPDPDAPTASLRLTISPEGASVFVDGERFVDPRSVRLPVGVHDLRLERRDYEPLRRVVELPEGGLGLVVALVPTPEKRAELASSAQAQRGAGIAAVVSGVVVAGVAVGLFGWNASERPGVAAARAAFDALPSTEKRVRKDEDARILGAEQRLGAVDVGAGLGLGLGVALGVVGAVLIGTGESPAKYRLPELGAVRLRPLADVGARPLGEGWAGQGLFGVRGSF
jgi:hypothetical protein